MAFQLETDKPLRANLRRLASRQLAKAKVAGREASRATGAIRL